MFDQERTIIIQVIRAITDHTQYIYRAASSILTATDVVRAVISFGSRDSGHCIGDGNIAASPPIPGSNTGTITVARCSNDSSCDGDISARPIVSTADSCRILSSCSLDGATLYDNVAA